jgi:hypothetical protein
VQANWSSSDSTISSTTSIEAAARCSSTVTQKDHDSSSELWKVVCLQMRIIMVANAAAAAIEHFLQVARRNPEMVIKF